MFRHLFQIVKNQSQIKVIDYILEVLIATAQEWKRSTMSGHFDVKNQNPNYYTPPTNYEKQGSNLDFGNLKDENFNHFKNL